MYYAHEIDICNNIKQGQKTMLKGIDVSSWQGDIDVQCLSIDFIIAKATESTNYVNPYCNSVIERAVANDILFGFYHYAQHGDPISEAKYFIKHTENYFGKGIPVLDWEENQSVDWVNSFVNYVHNETGIWCWIYANPWRFNQGSVESNCGRWVASYNNWTTHPDLDYDPGVVPYADGNVICWQYASDGRISGYNGNLDLNHFYGDRNQWLAYAGGKEEEDMTPEQSEKLDYIYMQLSRNDTAGHDNPDGHDFFGRIQIIENQLNTVYNQLTRTDTAGHDNPDGHDFFGRIQIIEHELDELMQLINE